MAGISQPQHFFDAVRLFWVFGSMHKSIRSSRIFTGSRIFLFEVWSHSVFQRKQCYGLMRIKSQRLEFQTASQPEIDLKIAKKISKNSQNQSVFRIQLFQRFLDFFLKLNTISGILTIYRQLTCQSSFDRHPYWPFYDKFEMAIF